MKTNKPSPIPINSKTEIDKAPTVDIKTLSHVEGLSFNDMKLAYSYFYAQIVFFLKELKKKEPKVVNFTDSDGKKTLTNNENPKSSKSSTGNSSEVTIWINIFIV